MQFHFTEITRNKKTGPMPVVTASKDTCPPDCSLMNNGCYAEHGKLGLFWRKMKGVSFADLIQKVRALPRGQVWRYGQAGDLPDDRDDVMTLAIANRGRPVICYTHKRDVETYKEATRHGFTINLSANSIEEADELAKTGLPVVVVLPSDHKRGAGESLREYRERLGGRLRLQTPGGNTVAICPEAYMDTNCLRCQACSKPRAGGTIIGFPAHGVRKGTIDKKLQSEVVTQSWHRQRPKTRITYNSSPISQRISP